MNAVEVEDNSVAFSADISGLRMATTYSFEVRPAKAQGEREDRADGDDKNQNIIVIPTKGCKYCLIFFWILMIKVVFRDEISLKNKYELLWNTARGLF